MADTTTNTWRASVLVVVCTVVLLAVGAIQLNSAGAEPRADLIGADGDGSAGSSLSPEPRPSPGPAAQTAESDPLVPATTTLPARSAGEPAAASPAQLPDVPTGLSIPSLGVLAPVVPVGLEEDRTMQIPGASEAGWYFPGRAPGAPTGSAVVAAHVDFNGDRGVFFDLRAIELGAEVVVTDASGTARTFVVTERTQMAKDQVPMAELFRTGGDPVLTLVTCGGAFDDGALSYADNIIVRAVPVTA